MLLIALERFLVYPVPSITAGAWNAASVHAEDVFFESADGTRLHGWYIDHPQPHGHILFCHGNGEHIGYCGPWLSRLSEELGCAIFVFDYRGYGKSEGKPFEQGVLEDGEAAQRWLATRAGIGVDRVVLYGRSLGGGVAVHLAAKLGARGLIIERTFHSMVEIGVRQYPWLPVRAVMRNRYPSIERIANYSGPLLQMHGAADRLIPIESARMLFAAATSDPKQFVEIPQMGHNDPAPGVFFQAIAEFLRALPGS